MSNQQYSHLLQVIAELSRQMADGFSTVNARLDKHEKLHQEHQKKFSEIDKKFAKIDQNFARVDHDFRSIYEILQDITDHLPMETIKTRR